MNPLATIKPSAYQKKAKQSARNYDARVLSKQERINELARQLNAGYKFMICR